MSKLFASWVPGYATVPQVMGSPGLNFNGQNYTDVNGFREGFGVTFHQQGRQENWYHTPIPTPVIVEDRRATLVRVIVLFRLPDTATLKRVNVWDGQTEIFANNGLSITGEHSLTLDDENTYDVNRDGIRFGVGVSLLISTIEDSDIFFGGGGGDFQHDI
ncbi:hypothetical protein P3T36_002410 [Kitasatospora sp. MAP12-15]|uniref:DUF6623 family protein n=1 Tax=unclassified Kitasatospora TaxID=2633591 RepID=UPI00247621E6|nr:DUF6623 family protein [Kitasatospora sp. MAP12-44]MDH6108669.1 hypothetical protein [Kitasatospora sp. MAP12-44]